MKFYRQQDQRNVHYVSTLAMPTDAAEYYTIEREAVGNWSAWVHDPGSSTELGSGSFRRAKQLCVEHFMLSVLAGDR